MMKKNLIWLLALILLIPTGLFAEGQEDTPYKFFVDTKYWNTETFSQKGHLGVGFGGLFDVGPSIYVKVSYGQINFCDTGDVKVLGIGAIWYFDLGGNGWSGIASGDAINNIGIGNPYSGTDITWGIGVKKTLTTWYPDKTFIPGTLDVSLILSHTDVELLESYVQAQIMFTVTRPVTK